MASSPSCATATRSLAGDGIPATVSQDRWRLSGELDFTTVADLQPRLAEALAGNKGLELDLDGITRANSAGLALLAQWHQDARRSGVRLDITHPPAALVELAELSNLGPLLGFGREQSAP